MTGWTIKSKVEFFSYMLLFVLLFLCMLTWQALSSCDHRKNNLPISFDTKINVLSCQHDQVFFWLFFLETKIASGGPDTGPNFE